MTIRKQKEDAVDVNDKKAEIGINLNNVLTALILGVMVWVGSSIEQIKDKVSEVVTSVAVNDSRIKALEIRVEQTEHDRDRTKQEAK